MKKYIFLCFMSFNMLCGMELERVASNDSQKIDQVLAEIEHPRVQEIKNALEKNDKHVKRALHEQMAQDALKIVCRDNNEKYEKYKDLLPCLKKRFEEHLKKRSGPLTRAPGIDDPDQYIEDLKNDSIRRLAEEETAKNRTSQAADLEAPAASRTINVSVNLNYKPQNNGGNAESNFSKLQDLVLETAVAHGASVKTQRNIAALFTVIGALGTAALTIYSAIPKGSTIPGTNVTIA